MQSCFLLMASFCLLYYLIIAIYTRKWSSTFSRFWLLACGCFGTFWIFWDNFSAQVQMIFGILFLMGGIFFCLVEGCIFSAMRTKVPQDLKYLIVLGAQVRGTYITQSLRRRLECAYQIWKQYPDIKIIVSGGQGKGEDISEAEAMKGYLLQKGIPSEQVIKEEQSTSTKENLLFSKKILGDNEKKIGIISNNFHIFRAVLIAKKTGLEKSCGISASSNRVLFLNYLVREFFAVLWIWLKK